jgi:plasmid maintenance system killer protein
MEEQKGRVAKPAFQNAINRKTLLFRAQQGISAYSVRLSAQFCLVYQWPEEMALKFFCATTSAK